MPAYAVVTVEVHNPEGYEEYRSRVLPTVQKYAGRFLVRGGRSELVEGDKQPERTVVLEFPSMEKLKEWYNSPEYQELAAIRQRHSRTEMFLLVEGA